MRKKGKNLMKNILDEIVATKWREIEAAKIAQPIADLEQALAGLPSVREFVNALRRPAGIQVIAEVKKASPSAGVIRPDFHPTEIAQTYHANGAACISVLTDRVYFQGEPAFLNDIRRVVPIPLLRKDFVLDRYQMVEARILGADAVLLIAEILPGESLTRLYSEARELGLDVLVELYAPENLPRVIDLGTPLIGINNRDLRAFRTDLNHTLLLLDKIPKDRTVVSESGIKTHDDLVMLEQAGVKAVLVGESLMRSPDIGKALRKLRTGEHEIEELAE
jgi:indole-3-glycerol phosphate synthase